MSVLLYFTWYKHLPAHAPQLPEEEVAPAFQAASNI
jgi:hypothetical protein